jgi:hypothetical protein
MWFDRNSFKGGALEALNTERKLKGFLKSHLGYKIRNMPHKSLLGPAE